MAWILLLSIISTALVSGSWAGCDDYGFLQCRISSGSESYMASIGIDLEDKHEIEESVLYTLNREQLRTYCTKYESYKICIHRDVMYSCSAGIRAVIQGLDNAFQNLCNDTFNEYTTQHQPCMSRLDVRDAVKLCAKTSIRKLDQDITSSSACKDMTSGEACETDAVESYCGIGTGTWFKKHAQITSQPLKDSISCQFYAYDDYSSFGEERPAVNENSQDLDQTYNENNGYYYSEESQETTSVWGLWWFYVCILIFVKSIFWCCWGYSRHRRVQTCTVIRTAGATTCVTNSTNSTIVPMPAHMAPPPYAEPGFNVNSDREKLVLA